MASPNGLLCFTNCLLPHEDGSLVENDLWIDEKRGVVLDAQASLRSHRTPICSILTLRARKPSSSSVNGQHESLTWAVI